MRPRHVPGLSPRSWPMGQGDVGLERWRLEERPLVALLDALAAGVQQEPPQFEREALARAPTGQQREVDRASLDHARAELELFRAAMRDAYGARPARVSYDSADPEQNCRAAALITYLVSTGRGDLDNDEVDSGRWVYRIAVDWPALERLASEIGLNLKSMLATMLSS